MTDSILATKLYIPSVRPQFVPRPRLIKRFQQEGDRKLTLISAPAGYGKTTLLSEWIQRSDRSTAWISLDESDNQLSIFLEYLVAAFQTIQADWGEMVLVQLPELETTSPISLINEIAASQIQVQLVLDDYHVISADLIHEMISFLIKHLPPNLHLIIATRTDPPLRLAQLRAQGELFEIRANDLRFTNEEAIHFLNQSMGLGLTSSDILTLSEKTEGWIAGLQLAAISLQGYRDKQAFVQAFAGDDRYIADYLLDEALDRQPPHIRTFLLQTAILNRLCAPLCNALLDRDDSQSILAELERANLFLVPLDNQRNWYRYHHLFASLLQHRLGSHLQIDEAHLHQKASGWLAEHGLFNEALYHAIKANNVDQLSKLYEENIFSVASYSEQNLLIDWANQQSDMLLIQKPWICIAIARALIDLSQLDNAERYLAYSEKSVSTQTRIRAHIAIARAFLADKQGDLDLMLKYAQKALAEADPDNGPLQAQVSAFLAKREFWAGNLIASEQISYRAYQDSISSGDYEEAVNHLTGAGSIQLIRGSISKGIKTLNEAVQLSEKIQQSTHQPVPSLASTYFTLADVLIEIGKLDDANQYLQDGMHLCELAGQPELSYMGYITYAKYLLAIGDLDNALDALREAQKLATLGGSEIRKEDYFTSLRARIYIAKGDLLKATELMDGIGIQASDPFEFEKQLIYRILAQLLVAQRDYQTAIELLSRIIEICSQAGSAIHTMKAQIIKALAHYHTSDLDAALESLTPVLALAASEGLLVQSFLEAGEPMARLLYQASLQSIYPEFCNQLLEHFSDLAAPDKRDGLVEPLSDRELEVLELIAQGQTNQEIAQELVLSLYTIKSHARNIFSKLGVKNRTEAVARARLLGILPQD